jgi:2,5-furandicarboxylate decarboxylase 1
MREEHLAKEGTNLLSDLCALLAYLAKRDRLALGRADEPAAVATRFGRDRAVLLVYPDGREISVDPSLLAVRYWVADPIGVSAAQWILGLLVAAREPLRTLEVESRPVRKIIYEDVDLLRQLPIPQHNKRESGSYIAAGLPIARNLKTGVHNVSIHRCQISGKNRISILQRRGMCSPTTPSRRIGRAGREWLQSQLAETAPLSGRNCSVSRLIVEARGEHLYDR